MVNRLSKGLRWLTLGIFGCAILVAWLQPVKFLGDPDWASPAVTLVLVAGILIIMAGLRRWVAIWSVTTYRTVLLGVLAAIVIAQLLVAINFVDAARADSFFVRSQVITIAQGHHTWQHYFMIYPNNVNEVLLESLLLKLGLNWTHNPWAGLNVLRFLWLDTGLLSGLWLLKHRRHWQPSGLSFAILWLLSLPIYAYGVFQYTDALVLPLIIDSLALVAASLRVQGWRHWALMSGNGLLMAFGVMMKSNLIVLWLAFNLLTLVFWGQHRLNWRQVLGWLLTSIVTLGLLFGAMSVWQRQAGYQKAPQSALPVTSWIMMSLNPSASGQYQSADFKLVNAQPTSQAKQTVTQTLIKQRLRQMGTTGLAVHLAKKFRIFWATGNFDSFKLTTQWTRAPKWYQNHQRSIQFWLVLGTQGLYLAVLIQGGWTLIRSRSWQTTFLVLTILGLTAFHVLFWEVEGRYALPLLPGLLLLAASGESHYPKMRRSLASRVLVSWLAVVFASFSLVSLWQTSQTTLLTNTVVARQGNGSYVQSTEDSLGRAQKAVLQVTASGPSDELDLSPLQQSGQVTITLRAGTRRVKTWRGQPSELRQLHYPVMPAQKFTVIIKNTGQRTVAYGAMRARYNPATGQVTQRSQAYLQYQLRRSGPVKTLTSGVTSTFLVSGLLSLVLWVIWAIPSRPSRHIGGGGKQNR